MRRPALGAVAAVATSAAAAARLAASVTAMLPPPAPSGVLVAYYADHWRVGGLGGRGEGAGKVVQTATHETRQRKRGMGGWRGRRVYLGQRGRRAHSGKGGNGF